MVQDGLPFEPPTRPIASCNFLFCPPDKVLALERIFASKSQSRSNCSKSSSLSELADHLTAFHTRSVWIHVKSGKRTLLCGTMPIVPRGGLRTSPAKVTVPPLLPAKPPIIDNAVDFPALSTYD